jgi:hypothetical protein
VTRASKPLFSLADGAAIANGASTTFSLDTGDAIKALVVVTGDVAHEVFIKQGHTAGADPAYQESKGGQTPRAEGNCWVVDVSAAERLGVTVYNNSGGAGVFSVAVMLAYRGM